MVERSAMVCSIKDNVSRHRSPRCSPHVACTVGGPRLVVWTKIGKAAQKREKQEWANEEPNLDNARRLRGIYFIDLDDEEYKEIIQKLEEEVGSACGRYYAVKKRKGKSEQLTCNWSEA